MGSILRGISAVRDGFLISAGFAGAACFRRRAEWWEEQAQRLEDYSTPEIHPTIRARMLEQAEVCRNYAARYNRRADAAAAFSPRNWREIEF